MCHLLRVQVIGNAFPEKHNLFGCDLILSFDTVFLHALVLCARLKDDPIRQIGKSFERDKDDENILPLSAKYRQARPQAKTDLAWAKVDERSPAVRTFVTTYTPALPFGLKTLHTLTLGEG